MNAKYKFFELSPPKTCTCAIASRGWWWLQVEKHVLTLTEYPCGLTQTYYAVKLLGVKFLFWTHWFGGMSRYENQQILAPLEKVPREDAAEAEV